MKSLTALFSVCLVFSSVSSSQTMQGLRVNDTTPVNNQWSSLIAGGARCDTDFNMYFSPATSKGVNSLLRISGDGKKTTQFLLSRVPELGTGAILTSYFAAEGRIYMVAAGPAGSAIAVFDKDGANKSLIKLEVQHASVNQMLAIDSRRFFIAGTAIAAGTGNRVPFTGIYDDAGRPVSSVNLGKKDVNKRTLSDSHDNPAAPSAYDIAISGSIADTSGDGNIYFVRAAPTGPVFVLSPSGQVLNVFDLAAPKGADKLIDMKVAGGRIAILHEGEPPEGGTAPIWITVIDSANGKPLSQYFAQDSEIGDLLACYTPAPVDTFIFLNSDKDGRLNIIHTVPK